jgi:hypothetical protein
MPAPQRARRPRYKSCPQPPTFMSCTRADLVVAQTCGFEVCGSSKSSRYRLREQRSSGIFRRKSRGPKSDARATLLACPGEAGEKVVARASCPLSAERPAPACNARAGCPRHSGRDAHATRAVPSLQLSCRAPVEIKTRATGLACTLRGPAGSAEVAAVWLPPRFLTWQHKPWY